MSLRSSSGVATTRVEPRTTNDEDRDLAPVRPGIAEHPPGSARGELPVLDRVVLGQRAHRHPALHAHGHSFARRPLAQWLSSRSSRRLRAGQRCGTVSDSPALSTTSIARTTDSPPSRARDGTTNRSRQRLRGSGAGLCARHQVVQQPPCASRSLRSCSSRPATTADRSRGLSARAAGSGAARWPPRGPRWWRRARPRAPRPRPAPRRPPRRHRRPVR